MSTQEIFSDSFEKINRDNICCPKVIFYETIDSTNDQLKIMADNGAQEGTVVVSYCQTNGHGRSGRNFYSPTGGNLYMSILLRPDNLEAIGLITPAAAVAVSRAIKKMTDVDVQIKWVNDIFLNGRKICGILASGYGFENNKPYVVLGIGINVSVEADSVPEEIRDIYGSLFDSNEGRLMPKDFLPKFACSVYEEYMWIYQNMPDREFMNEYRERSNLIGRDVFYLSGEEVIPVKVLDIDNDGALELLHEDGSRKKYKDGEIRIKLR